ncbi:hypothetical protein [Pseudoalteromonas luteoviolacea]|uniref:hypothetical protein n=1 Tax=Pseudoalteromonas luteoviolacea TaxID=43657 RepID=UPI00126A26D7|nr:hypothetical protein [Pseudoalteromonas luteoviolacea]
MKLKLVKKKYKQLNKNTQSVCKEATPLIAGGWVTTVCTDTDVTNRCYTIEERTCNTCNTAMC